MRKLQCKECGTLFTPKYFTDKICPACEDEEEWDEMLDDEEEAEELEKDKE